MEKICVIGLGYIGLPTASLLAVKGYKVHGMDVRVDVVGALNEGKVLIHEPGLNAVVKSAVGSGNLQAYGSPAAADIFILALPTPFKEGKKPDLSFVRQGVEEIAPYLKPGNLVILESTSPVGTSEKICDWLQELRPDLKLPGRSGGEGEQIYVAHCPERVLPGKILEELIGNDRIVGGVDKASTEKAAEFYKSFVQGAVLPTDSRTAELAKLVENSYRDVNIAFANELSLICEDLGVDVWETIKLANRHPRVNILAPGAGVGGHCIAVDPWFIVDAAPERARLISTARKVNDYKAEWVYGLIAAEARRCEKPVIACLGLAFKPDIDDLRGSPALRIVEKLAASPDWQILVVEPNIAELPPSLAGRKNVRKCSQGEALSAADILAFLVRHEQFRDLTTENFNARTAIDSCGILQNIGI